MRWLAGLCKSLPLAINQTSLARGATHFLSGQKTHESNNTSNSVTRTPFCAGESFGDLKFSKLKKFKLQKPKLHAVAGIFVAQKLCFSSFTRTCGIQFRQTAGGFTSRGGSTKKSLEVFCVLVMVPRVLLHCGWFLYSRHPSCHGRGWRHVWC